VVEYSKKSNMLILGYVNVNLMFIMTKVRFFKRNEPYSIDFGMKDNLENRRLCRYGVAGEGAFGFAEEEFGMALDDVIRQFADAGIAEMGIELLRAVIEGGDAEEDVGALGKDAFLGELHEASAHALALGGRMHREELDITIEHTIKVQDEDTDGAVVHFSDAGFTGGMSQTLKESIGIHAEGEPGVGSGHEGGAGLRFSNIAQRADDWFFHELRMGGNEEVEKLQAPRPWRGRERGRRRGRFIGQTLNFERARLNLYSAYGQR
jgi:hypothetical protein